MKQGRNGRNDLCPCGSGKKFKNCCLQAESAPLESAKRSHGDGYGG